MSSSSSAAAAAAVSSGAVVAAAVAVPTGSGQRNGQSAMDTHHSGRASGGEWLTVWSGGKARNRLDAPVSMTAAPMTLVARGTPLPKARTAGKDVTDSEPQHRGKKRRSGRLDSEVVMNEGQRHEQAPRPTAKNHSLTRKARLRAQRRTEQEAREAAKRRHERTRPKPSTLSFADLVPAIPVQSVSREGASGRSLVTLTGGWSSRTKARRPLAAALSTSPSMAATHGAAVAGSEGASILGVSPYETRASILGKAVGGAERKTWGRVLADAPSPPLSPTPAGAAAASAATAASTARTARIGQSAQESTQKRKRKLVPVASLASSAGLDVIRTRGGGGGDSSTGKGSDVRVNPNALDSRVRVAQNSKQSGEGHGKRRKKKKTARVSALRRAMRREEAANWIVRDVLQPMIVSVVGGGGSGGSRSSTVAASLSKSHAAVGGLISSGSGMAARRIDGEHEEMAVPSSIINMKQLNSCRRAVFHHVTTFLTQRLHKKEGVTLDTLFPDPDMWALYWSEFARREHKNVLAVSSSPPQQSLEMSFYGKQAVNPELDQIAIAGLTKLRLYHNRVVERQRATKKHDMLIRYVCGLKQILKLLRRDRMRVILVARNIHVDVSVLNDKLGEILVLAREKRVPVVFALTRKVFGRVMKGKQLVGSGGGGGGGGTAATTTTAVAAGSLMSRGTVTEVRRSDDGKSKKRHRTGGGGGKGGFLHRISAVGIVDPSGADQELKTVREMALAAQEEYAMFQQDELLHPGEHVLSRALSSTGGTAGGVGMRETIEEHKVEDPPDYEPRHALLSAAPAPVFPPPPPYEEEGVHFVTPPPPIEGRQHVEKEGRRDFKLNAAAPAFVPIPAER